MKTFLNIIWYIPFLGFMFALVYAIIGAFFCIIIIGMPVGLGLLQFAKFLLWPFGRAMVSSSDVHTLKGTQQNDAWKTFSVIVRILYFPVGLCAAVSAIALTVAEFISLIGIPCGLVWARSLGTIFNPVNKVCVPEVVARAIREKKDSKIMEKYTPAQPQPDVVGQPAEAMPQQTVAEQATAATMPQAGEPVQPDTSTGMGKGATMTALIAGGIAIAGAIAYFTLGSSSATISMTTDAIEITIGMAGTGEAVINWGDGSEPETVALSPFEGKLTSSLLYTHTFSGNRTPYTIAIDGQNITLLHCESLQLTSLDVTKNTALAYLNCYNNQLTKLDVKKNSALTHLGCSKNQLTELDVSRNSALKTLYCYNNQLTVLDVTNNGALTELWCTENKLTSLDVTNNTALTLLFCDNNRLTNLDMTKNTAIETLNCWGNDITSLDVTNNTALTGLYCGSNELTSLDVTNNTALTKLDCNGNKLTDLDITNNTVLTELDCRFNQLTGLDTKNPKLTDLSCDHNQLTSLDVTKNRVLTKLSCGVNQLTSLDVTNNTALTILICSNNQLTVGGLTALFGTLHNNYGKKTIYIEDNPGSDYCKENIAWSKGWTVL